MGRTETLALSSEKIPPAARLFMAMAARLRAGHLQLVTPQGVRHLFGDAREQPGAELQVRDWRACERILRAGDIGLGEAWRDGWCDSPDLVALLQLALANEAVLDNFVHGHALARVWYRLRHWLNRNSRRGSRRNIHAHYDLGNDFYRRWLDPGMTYSSALFEGDVTRSLAAAQAAKYQRIIDTLQIRPGSRVLEIGCGWGGFAEHAARQDIQVHGITISPAQLAFARQRLADAGLAGQAQLELVDYRDLSGQYDHVVSIEMFEAVGERYWPQYFRTVCERLKPGGSALVQTITIADSHFERYRAGSDFIQQFIFPGGMLPSRQVFVERAAQAGLTLADGYHFGKDYAETLRRWRTVFEAEHEAISAQGFDAAFMRLWRLYLAYCEVGFESGRTDVVQFHLRRGS